MTTTNADDLPIHGDLLEGAAAIAEFIWGDPDKRRKVYRLVNELPLFRMGPTIYGRKSTLLAHVAEKERRSRTAGR
jgi:hypothetical protein